MNRLGNAIAKLCRPRIAAAALVVGVAGTAVAEVNLMDGQGEDTKLLFNADVIGGWYTSNDSWFGESESFLGANTDNWADLGLEPKLTFETRAGKGTLFAALSGVYTSTAGDDASGLTVGIDGQSELTLEQGNMGWKREDLLAGLEGDTFTITGGRFDYNIGSGMLINDGGGDGGERGGWYLGMRKAFSESLLAQLDSDTWLFEAFTLKNRPREGGTQGELYGANVEYSFGETATIGTTFMKVESNQPGQEQLDVYSARADWKSDGGFGLAGEHADESSGQIEAAGYFAEVSYELADSKWAPAFSYRYAHFDGDDPLTPTDERFREIAYGFTDWGSWYQGEITGEYALGNGNLESQRLRATLVPKEGVTFNVMYYDFKLDHPVSFGVLSDDWGDEINFTLDWEVNDKVYLIGVIGALFPGTGAEQFVGTTNGDDWIHSMLYVTYSW